MAPMIWLGICLLLILGETLIGDLSMLMLAGGALAAAGVSLADVPLWGQVVVWAVVTLSLIVTVRPFLRKKMLSDTSHEEVESGPKALAGKTAVVVEEITGNTGLVQVSGELWTARPLLRGSTIPVDTEVTVVNIDGNTAVVDPGL